MRRGLLTCALVVIAFLTVAAFRTAATARADDAPAVAIDNYAFTPAEITIAAGTTVTWSQLQANEVHTVTSIDGVWDSNVLNTGATYSFQFTTPGDFRYDCSVHPDLMMGVVHVHS